MSIDSTSSSPTQSSTLKHRIDMILHNNKPLQSSLSQCEDFPPSRGSLKSPLKDQQRQQSVSRTRTMSATEEASADIITELTSIPTKSNKNDNKHDRRYSELKPPIDRNDHTSAERRNSTPQIHLSALIPHPFRNPKHLHKTNSKDETNATNITSNNANAAVANSSIHSSDMMTMKADPLFQLKSPTTSANGPRLIPSNSNDRSLSSQIEDSISKSSFILDENRSEPRSAELFVFESHTPMSVSEIYREHFFDYFHTNYYGEFDYEGPFIASLRYIYQKTSITDICEARAIIRTPYRNCDISEIVNGTNENNILQMLFNKAHLPSVRTYGTVGDPKANEKLYLFDKTNDERFNCKIGVIYQRANQTNEYNIFSNDDVPNDMCEFLHRISNQINLKGFQKYRGDLDIKDGLHGEYSYHTEYENHEIMFNIAPLIPSTKANGQCIERKGLVGNAFVCIVFQEPGAIFSPNFISGKVIQIYITVQLIINDEEPYYKIAIWRRNDIKAIIDPPGGVYKYDKSFRSYFLTLLLNAVNVAIESPSLRSRVYEQRQRLKYEELKKFCQVFSLGPIPDFTSEIDNVHYPMDMRSNTRSESLASITTTTTSDSTSSNPARTSPVSSKKKGLSKIFGVFSGRSGSISSASATPNQINNDGPSSNSQTPPLPDTAMAFGRTIMSPNKEGVRILRSTKPNQAPVLPLRSSISQIPQNISIQPPTPSALSINPFSIDNLIQNNPLNTAALNITPRNRSNSSPEDTVNTNKPQSFSVSKIDEESHSTTSSADDGDTEDESSEDERPINRSVISYSNRNT